MKPLKSTDIRYTILQGYPYSCEHASELYFFQSKLQSLDLCKLYLDRRSLSGSFTYEINNSQTVQIKHQEKKIVEVHYSLDNEIFSKFLHVTLVNIKCIKGWIVAEKGD